MFMPVHYCLFETPIGLCGLVWRGKYLVRLLLPDATPAGLRQRLADQFPDATECNAPHIAIRRLVNKVALFLEGRAIDFRGVALDVTDIPAFHQRVYAVVRQIPFGKTQTYKQVAEKAGSPFAFRAVGQAMARNPVPLIVPCHRVTAANGRLGGFTAFGGTDIKQWLLKSEGVDMESTRENENTKSNNNQYGFDVRKAIRHLCAVDTEMAVLINDIGPFCMQINPTQNVFLALAEAIVYQQLHGKAAATIFNRLQALLNKDRKGFTAQDMHDCSDDALRAAGLSHNKVLALRDLASKTLDGSLPDLQTLSTLDNQSIINCFTTVRGIGRWTVEMLLMFKLGRVDVLPVDDYGIRKGFMLAFNQAAMPTSKALQVYGLRWAPYRTVASWYLWRAADRAKEKKA